MKARVRPCDILTSSAFIKTIKYLYIHVVIEGMIFFPKDQGLALLET